MLHQNLYNLIHYIFIALKIVLTCVNFYFFKAGIGGPLIDLCGNFIGMNFYGAKRTPYLPRHIILEQLKDFDRKGYAFHLCSFFGISMYIILWFKGTALVHYTYRRLVSCDRSHIFYLNFFALVQ